MPPVIDHPHRGKSRPGVPAYAGLRDGLRTLAIFHLADTSGPSKGLRPRLAALAECGSLEVLAPGVGTLASEYAVLGPVRAIDYEVLTVPRRPGEAVRALRRLGRDVRRFRREMRRARPDLVVVVTTVLPAALIAARLERLPTVVDVGEIFAKGYVGGPARMIGGRAIGTLTERLADRLVCCSRAVVEQFSPRGRAKAVLIYPGIDAGHAEGDGAEFRAAHGLEDARPLVAVIGHLSPARGQDTAIRALPALRARLPGARLVIAGAPPRPIDRAYAAELSDLAEQCGVADAVVFVGFVERIADVYAAADVVVNPARFNEPFGRVGPEALIAGRPVVATAVGAIPEVLRHGRDALLVPPDDAEALAGAVIRLVEDDELRERIVREGGRRVRERFGEAQGVAAFERVVAEAGARRAGAERA